MFRNIRMNGVFLFLWFFMFSVVYRNKYVQLKGQGKFRKINVSYIIDKENL